MDLTILKGKTFSRVLRWETEPLVYKAITAITKAAPVAITSTSHGLVDGWRAAVVSAGGMRQINAKNWPLRTTDFHKITKTGDNGITLNDVNSLSYTTYTSGGSLVYYTPTTLTGYTARMQIRATADSTTVLESLTSAAGDIVISDAAKTITITISAADTAAYDFDEGVYDFEMVSSDGTPVVTQLLTGNVYVVDEVTR
jgi:hypothetical protein